MRASDAIVAKEKFESIFRPKSDAPGAGDTRGPIGRERVRWISAAREMLRAGGIWAGSHPR